MVFNEIECYMYIKTYIRVYIFSIIFTLCDLSFALIDIIYFWQVTLFHPGLGQNVLLHMQNLNGGFETIGTLLAAKISFLYKKWANVFLTEWRSNSLARQPTLPHTRGRASMHWTQRSCVITAYPACDSRWNQLGEFMVNI